MKQKNQQVCLSDPTMLMLAIAHHVQGVDFPSLSLHSFCFLG